MGRSFAVALLIGVTVAIVFGLNLPNQVYTLIGDNAASSIDPAYRPLVVGAIVWAVIGVLLGIGISFRLKSAGSRFGALIGLILAGALFGAFTAITFSPQVGVALGIAAGYAAWIALMIADMARTGVDTEALKARYTPNQTIDTSKETLEWLQKRMPPGIGS